MGVGVSSAKLRDFRREPAAATASDSAINVTSDLTSAEFAQTSSMLHRNVAEGRSMLSLSAVGAPWLFSLSQCLVVFLFSVGADFAYRGIILELPGLTNASVSVSLISGILFAGAMHIVDGSRPLRKLAGREALRDVSIVWICVVLLITFLAFSLKTGHTLSRGMMFAFLSIGYVALTLTRSFVSSLMAASSRLANASGHHILVIGARGHSAARTLIDELMASSHHKPTHIEIDVGCDDTEWHAKLPFVLRQIFSSSRDNGRGDICIAAEGFSTPRLRDISDSIRVIPRAVCMVPDATVEALFHLPVQIIGGLYSLELQKPPMNAPQRVGKRALDLAISLPLLVFIAPLLAALAIAIKLDSRGPVLFVQTRLGYRGRAFSILKFRTMSVLENGDAIAQARKDDERVTRVGRWLRRTSLDELPQLLNVIRGQMSLVGPRPHAMAHDAFYEKYVLHYEVRQHVKPGISGWAQVNGLRGETASADLMRKRVEYDIWYAKNASAWLDIKILFLTAVVVIRQCNAY